MRVQVLYWQEIPSVVRCGDVKRQLPDWFQHEIDRVAMEQELLGSDDYLAQWEWRDYCEADCPEAEAVDRVADELEARALGS
ncbi:MAG TPA: virulence factor [Gaiellaceae bacterium]|nr:virulence factor [Gaiellaceae bacterium]